jgi:hypothetical protein
MPEVTAMMKLFATFFLLLVFSPLLLGQTIDKTKTAVIWSPDPNCHQSNSEAVKALKPVCSSVQVEDMTFQIINLGGVSYAMTNRPVRDYLVASVQISNKTNAPMEVIAKRSRLGRYKSAEEYTTNAKGEFGSAQSQDELRQASYREGEIGEREGGIRSGLRVRDKFEVDYNRGRILRRPGSTIDEPEAPPTENPMPSKITSELLIPKVVFDNILKSKTLASGEKTAGHLVFKNSAGEKAYVVLYLNAGQFEFVFPTMPK